MASVLYASSPTQELTRWVRRELVQGSIKVWRRTCTLRHMKGLCIERHNEAVACVSKAFMKGRKGGCLTVLMIDAGWHGKVTGIAASERIPQQVLPSMPDAVLKRM